MKNSELLELVNNDEYIASAFESGAWLMVFSRTERRLRSLYMSREGGKLWEAEGEVENEGELPSGGGTVRGDFKIQEAAGKDKDRPVFTGVYHDGEEGVAVSTDTMIMVVSHKDYDPRHKGEVVYGSGKNETSEARPLGVGGYPDYRRVQPQGSRPVAGEVTLSGGALDALERHLSAALKIKGGKGESIAVKIGKGYCRVSLEKLYRFVRAMRHLWAKEEKLHGGNMLVAEGRDGRVLLMVHDPSSHMVYDVKYRTELGREAEASEPTTETAEVREAEAEYGGESYGDFGPIFTQFKGDARGAVEKLKHEQRGEATAALYHDDVGDIDLVWGREGTGRSDGYGLAKLLKHHPEVVENLQEILEGMHVTTRSDNRIHLESETHQAAVHLTWNKKEKKWLLTAFEKNETSEPTDKTTDTDDNPIDLRGDTALSQNSDVSGGQS